MSARQLTGGCRLSEANDDANDDEAALLIYLQAANADNKGRKQERAGLEHLSSAPSSANDPSGALSGVKFAASENSSPNSVFSSLLSFFFVPLATPRGRCK